MDALVVVVATVVALWLVLVAVVLTGRRSVGELREATRLVPDVIRLVKRLATDPATPRRHRLALWLLAAYLVSPVDLVPDFIPVIGYADDVVLTALVLRRVVAAAAPGTLERLWPGRPGGLATLRRALRLSPVATSTDD